MKPYASVLPKIATSKYMQYINPGHIKLVGKGAEKKLDSNEVPSGMGFPKKLTLKYKL